MSESEGSNQDIPEDPPSSLEDYVSNDSLEDENEEIIEQKKVKTNKKKIKNEKKKKKIEREEYLKFYEKIIFHLIISEDKIQEQELRNAIWDQVWLIAIIGIFFMLLTFSKYYEEKYTKYARYMFQNKENFKVA